MECTRDFDIINKYIFKASGTEYLYVNPTNKTLSFFLGDIDKDGGAFIGKRFFVKKDYVVSYNINKDNKVILTAGFGDTEYSVNKALWIGIAAGVAGLLILISVVSAIIGHIMYGMPKKEKKGSDHGEDDYSKADHE